MLLWTASESMSRKGELLQRAEGSEAALGAQSPSVGSLRGSQHSWDTLAKQGWLNPGGFAELFTTLQARKSLSAFFSPLPRGFPHLTTRHFIARRQSHQAQPLQLEAQEHSHHPVLSASSDPSQAPTHRSAAQASPGSCSTAAPQALSCTCSSVHAEPTPGCFAIWPEQSAGVLRAGPAQAAPISSSPARSKGS